MAMGATQDTIFGQNLILGLGDESIETRIAALQALGMIQYAPAVEPISRLMQDTETETERLSATISLGMIGDSTAIPFLEILLEDEEANIRWDAAIALAKMGSNSGAYIIEGLLDRKYLNKFIQIDPVEQQKVLMVAIKTASILFDKRFEDDLISLSKNDADLKIRDAAIKALENNYSNGTN
jgi:HEAT repeat protein